ncbi:probable phosphoglycerate mutase [Novosphingobium sp. CF614]|uniref:histidine phosphatase family protein n=1 Tax=Novosphingobium sp. CF614 TaxID=1884364 RepID=UPI0008E75FE4|nr:histidine phosphatase family protein [Novosphingobium sp. CF614]SFG46240.1 probable phosphoglycerate mutase [Novosphingobium sp. CF614]
MIVIVRHGNTFAADEPPRRVGSRTDLPLTAEGEEQARALAAHFRANGWRFTRALVSPLLRTRETARIILAAQSPAPEPEACAWLGEIDHGPDENQTEDRVAARIGQAALAAWDERAVPPPGWIVDTEARLAGWRTLLAVASGEAGMTLVVTSNGAARFALLADPGLAGRIRELPGLKLPTGSYGRISADGASWRIADWGRRP